MDNKINLSQLADLLAQAGGMTKTASEQFVKNFFDIISQSVLSDGLVKVKGFGTFKVLQIEDRESVNVNTGERFTIEGHQKISFTPDSELKERINKPFSAFEIVEITSEQADELARIEDEPKKQQESALVVKDVTQKRGVRFLLKLLLWIVSIILIVSLLLYLLWPLIGNRVLDTIERNIKVREKTELVTDSVKTTAPAVQPSAEPEQTTTPAPKPATPATPAAKPVTPAAPAVKPAAPAVQPVRFNLSASDQAKDLKDFTEADTVNYIMDGDMTVHELKSGETITALALKYYGSKKLWPYIVKYNNIKNPGALKPGAKIRIPVLKNR